MNVQADLSRRIPFNFDDTNLPTPKNKSQRTQHCISDVTNFLGISDCGRGAPATEFIFQNLKNLKTGSCRILFFPETQCNGFLSYLCIFEKKLTEASHTLLRKFVTKLKKHDSVHLKALRTQLFTGRPPQ